MDDDIAAKPNCPTGDSPGYRFVYGGRRAAYRPPRPPNPAVEIHLSQEAEDALRQAHKQMNHQPPDTPENPA